MKITRPFKKSRIVKVEDFDDDIEPFKVKQAARKMAPASSLLGDGSYVQVFERGKWKLVKKYASSTLAREAFDKLRKKGRYRTVKIIEGVWHIADSAYILDVKKEEEPFFNKSKVRKKEESNGEFFSYKRKFKHRTEMRVEDLKDEEHYIVTIRTGFGCAIRIIPGYRLKNRKFYRKLAVTWLISDKDHWIHKYRVPYYGNYPKSVEVILPPNEKGQVFVSDVTPYSATDYEEREKKDPEFQKLVSKYSL